jgi:uncharacterized C2H2 Zn-finger protein
MNCPICQLKFKSEKSYINHLEKKHKEEDDVGVTALRVVVLLRV